MTSASRILARLEGSTATGAEADGIARLGFLEWLFGLGGASAGQSARATLVSADARAAQSPAARAFVGLLYQATRPMPPAASRARRRRLPQ